MPVIHRFARSLGILSSSLSLLALSGLLCVACDGSDTGGGEDPTSPVIPAEAPETPATPACSATGTGNVMVEVTGLPAGVTAAVQVSGPTGAPQPITASQTIAGAAAGSYTVTAERVANVAPIVRTVFEPRVSIASFCLGGTQTQTVTVTYADVATSNKLWATNANSDSGQLVAFAATDLGATGAPAAKVAAKAPTGKAVAFDKEGNLWSIGATTADGPLARFAAADLAASGTKTPDRKITPALTGCSPSLSAIAFDPTGTLWAADLCADRLLRVSAETLSTSREYTPSAADIAIGTIHGPRAIAFDKSGNMFVSDATSIHLYPAASLAAGQPHVPTLKIDVKAAGNAELPPDALAFDKDGNLWVTSFGGNVVSRLTPADLAPAGAGIKEVVPAVQLTISVGALLESLAFDESGGLWLTYSQGKIARVAPSQLGISTSAGAPTIPETIASSADVGYAGALAFFPAAAGLPLYSRFAAR